MLLMQELWLRKLDWHERLPNDLQGQWFGYHNTLDNFESLKFPRWTGQLKTLNIELHGFSDELCGAALLAKLLISLMETMSLESVSTHCHTDSVTVLAWLGKHSSN